MQVSNDALAAEAAKAGAIPDHVPPEMVVDYRYGEQPGFAADPQGASRFAAKCICRAHRSRV